MLQIKYYPIALPFQYPFTTYKGTKTHQPSLIVSMTTAGCTGYGEAPAISYYDVTVDGMIAVLEAKRASIERFSLTDPKRFWHFLHHLMPGQHFLTAALDIATWDAYGKMCRKPVYQLLGLKWENIPATDYTIGIDTTERMIEKMTIHPAPVYKIKTGTVADIDTIIALREHTNAPFRVDANEGWTFDEAKRLIPELASLGVKLVEQPLKREETDAMRELKDNSILPLYADESCQNEADVKKCANGFHGINIKLTKCGGITPALAMIQEARKQGLTVMLGSMNESSIGTAAIANLLPLAGLADCDGPLLLSEDIAIGLRYDEGIISLNGEAGLGVRCLGMRD